MSVVDVNTHSLVTVNDEVVIVNSAYEGNAVIFIRSLTTSADVEISSGIGLEYLGATTPFNLPGIGVTIRIDYPVGAATIDKVSKLSVTKGQVAVSIVSPSEVRSYLTVQRG